MVQTITKKKKSLNIIDLYKSVFHIYISVKMIYYVKSRKMDSETICVESETMYR